MKEAEVNVRLLGAFRVELGAFSAAFRSDSERALLAFLATEPESHRRDSLSVLLWPETDEKSARSNLRVSLHRVRKALNDPEGQILRLEQKDVRLEGDGLQVDARLFTEAVDRIEHHNHRDITSCVQCSKDLQIAVDLYSGEFLKGFLLKDNQPFLEWKTIKQEQFHRAALQCHFQLAEVYAARKEFAFAERHARRQLELEPWREIAHRQLMTFLSAKGERSAALAQYETCRRVLMEELGVEPAEKTKALFDRIRAREAPSTTATALKPDTARASSKWHGARTPELLVLALTGLVVVGALMRQFGLDIFSVDQTVYDDFGNSQHHGSFDSAKWIEAINFGPACHFVQQDGELLISEDASEDALGCNLRAKRPPSSLGGQLGSISARFKLADSHNGVLLAAVLRFTTELSNGGWSADCGLHAGPHGLVVQLTISDTSRQRPYENPVVFTSFTPVDYEVWQTVTLEAEPLFETIRCRANGEVVGDFTPANQEELEHALFRREIGSWWDPRAMGAISIDDVVIVPPPMRR